ncbi:MAG: FtsL-like putative cell division protein [Flavobacteriaceae bacterium]
MNKINKIILGNFLIEEGSLKNWKLVTFLFIMAIIMIFSSHSIDKKIILIGDLKNDVSVLESKFLENRKSVMKLKMESNVLSIMKERGIKSFNNPPKKIIVN